MNTMRDLSEALLGRNGRQWSEFCEMGLDGNEGMLPGVQHLQLISVLDTQCIRNV